MGKKGRIGERESDTLFNTVEKPSNWSVAHKQKRIEIEEKIRKQLTQDIKKYHSKWETKYIKSYEQMDRWFFGLGKEKEKTMYPPEPPTEDEENEDSFPQ